MSESFSFRPHSIEDVAFIDNSWGASYYAGIKAFKFMSPKLFHTHHREIRHKILSDPKISITICTPSTDSWHILGYSVAEPMGDETKGYNLIHYLYVKESFRDAGLAQTLISKSIDPSKPTLYTHLTYRAGELMAKNQEQFKQFSFIPHII